MSGCVSSKWAKGTGGPSGDEAYNLVANPLTARMSKGVNTTLDEGQTLVAYRKSKRAQPVTDDESWVEAETANTINAFDVGERDTHVVAIGVDCNNALLTGQVTETLRSRPGINAAVIAQRDTHAVAFQSNLGTRGGDVFTDGSSPTVRVGSALGIPSPPAVAVAHSLRGEGFDASEDGTGRGTPLVVATAFSITPASGQGADLQATEADVGSGLSAVSMGDTTDRGIRIVSKETARPASVRRLTPRECERLQGFPDDWTAIPWRGRAAEDCPDGPRYRALGNSMAVNCMEWLGERIAAWEARK